MTKDKLETRIKTLENERDQMKNAIHIYDGAIQDCKHWLSQLEAPVEEAPETTES